MAMNGIQFLKCLYGQDTLGKLDAYIALTMYNKDRSQRGGPTFRFKSYAEAIAHAQLKRSQWDIYYNLGLQAENLGPGKRGTWENIIMHPGLYFDADIAHDIAHKKSNLPRNIEEVKTIFHEAFHGKTYAILVDSGFGAHIYAPMPKPIIIKTPQDALALQISLIRAHEHFKSHMAKYGYTIDSVFDLPRILRLVDTYNHKEVNHPRVCTVLEHSDQRFEMEDWMSHCPEFTGSYPSVEDIEAKISGEPPKKKTRSKQKQVPIDMPKSEEKPKAEKKPEPKVRPTFDGESITIDLSVVRPDLLIKTMCETSKAFERDFNRKDKDTRKDASPSSYDMGIANACANAGLEDQQIADILICFRREQYAETDQNWANKLTRKDYLPRTIAAAKKQFAKSQAINEIAAAPLEVANGDPEIIAKNLKTVSSAFGFDVIAVIKYQGDSCQYDMQTEHGTIRFPSTERLITFRHFKVIVADRTGIVVRNMKAEQWEPLAQAILNSAIVEQMQGIDTCSIVADYIRRTFNKATSELDAWKTANQSKKPFVKDNKFYTFCDTVYDAMRFDGRIMNLSDIATAMVRLGCKNKKRNFYGSEEGKRMQAYCWEVPQELVHGETVAVSDVEEDNEDLD